MRRTITILGVVALVLACAPVARATPGTLYIESDTTLAEDHYGTIAFDADGITLDCAGHTVFGPGESGFSGGIDTMSHAGVTVRRCTVTGFDVNGIFGGGGPSGRYEHNVLYENANHGMHVASTSGSFIVGNESYSNGAIGIVVTDFTQGEIRDNTVHDNTNWAGIALFDGSNANVVSGNTSSGNVNGFELIGSSNNVLAGNVSTSNWNEGYFVHGDANGNRFEQNEATGNANKGFELSNVTGNELTGNTSSGNGSEGIVLWSSTAITLVGNTFEDNYLGLGMDDSSSNVIRENSFVGNGLWGVLLAYSSNDNEFVDNVASHNGLDGFSLNGSTRNHLDANVANDNTGDGVVLTEATYGNVVEHNTANGNDRGFSVRNDSNDNAIRGNLAEDNSGSGFEVLTGTRNVLASNTANENGGNGFEVSDSTNPRLERNTSTANQQRGFSIWSSSGLVLYGNEARDNAWYNFEAHASQGMTWRQNSARDGGGGFYLAEGSSGNTLEGNVAEGGGFAFKGDNNLIVGNVARHSGGSGFDVFSGSGNVLRGNRSERNGYYGFGLSGDSKGTMLLGNQAMGNAAEGVALVYGASGNQVVGNTSQGNLAEGISLYFGAHDNVIRNNVITGNAGSGVLVHESSRNVITGNRLTRNNLLMDENSAGIAVRYGSTFNEITGNIACSNGVTDGYEEASSSQNTWQRNRLCKSSISTATTPYITVDVVGFGGPSCSAAVVDIANKGDAEQPFGWTLTLEVPEAGISNTYEGQQPLAAGASLQTVMATGLTEPGTYTVNVLPGDVAGPSRYWGRELVLPATC